MRGFLKLAAGMAGAAVVTAAVAATAIPSYITAAVANPNRPDADKQRDDARKPAETIAFAGIKPGWVIADYIPGTGYYDRIFSGVVGPKGHVYGFYPAELKAFVKTPLPPDGAKPFDKFDNVTTLSAPANDFAAPAALDLVWISDNYHDLHDPFFAPADLAKVNAAVFKALKPGGLYLVIDHAAPAGSGLADTNTLHRIDEASVKSEVEAAGFKLAGESDVLHNPADDHSKKIFDPAIRGHTDQFILKFRKPKA
ncbi:MAG TPA: methyltransferase [Caulobacteraceae bacterium]|jgi:predicted methyltransferase|nr:methyltransferase [Caulobacteraceae bacterium]